MADDGTVHALYGHGDRALQVRFRWIAGPGKASLAAELPIDPQATGPWLNTLGRFSRLLASARGVDHATPDPRGRRFSLILSALDASLAGASQREIAAALVGAERAEADWRHPGQHLRDRVRRAVRRGRDLMNGGYLALLR
jgi:hypothetical protein